MYDYLVIDGSASNTTLTNRIMCHSNINLIPFLPSPIDWDVTKKMIDNWLLQIERGEEYKQLILIINQFDNAALSKEYSIILNNMKPKFLQLQINKRNAYKEIMLNGEVTMDNLKKWKNSDINLFCKKVNELIEKGELIKEIINF